MCPEVRNTALALITAFAVAAPFAAQSGVRTPETTPVFPVGVYHVGEYTVKMLKADNPAFDWDLDHAFAQLPSHGFNFVHTMSPPDDAYLEAAARHGLKVVVELSTFVRNRDMAGLAAAVGQLKGSPLILAWAVVDEPNPDMLPTVAAASALVKRLDPTRPVMIDVNVPDWFDGFAGLCDVLATDPYPLLEGGDRPIGSVAEYLERARARKSAVWLIPQCFAADGAWREPRPDELTCMVYQGLCAGAKGLAYYALTSGEPFTKRPPFKHWFLPASPLWDAVKSLNAEVAALGPVLINGRRSEAVQCESADVRALALDSNGSTYALAVNTSRLDQQASFEFQGGDEVRVLYGPGDVTRHANGFRVKLRPLERGVYEIKGKLKRSKLKIALQAERAKAVAGDTLSVTVAAPEIAGAKLLRTDLKSGPDAMVIPGSPVSYSVFVKPKPEGDSVTLSGSAEYDVDGKPAFATCLKTLPIAMPFDLSVERRYNLQGPVGEQLVSMEIIAQPGPTRSGRLELSASEGWAVQPEGFDLEVPGNSRKTVICYAHPASGAHKVGRLRAAMVLTSGVRQEYDLSLYVPLLIDRAPKALSVDADLSDWNGSTFTHIGGGSNLAARFALAYDERSLYLAVEVLDRVLLQDQRPEEMWKQDSVQIAFDPLDDGKRIGSPTAYGPDDWEYGTALVGGKPVVWRWAGEKPGMAEGARAAVKRGDDSTVYELELPWLLLKPLTPKSGRPFGISILVNNDDGGGRETVRWGGGIESKKNPSEFMQAILR